MTLHRLGISGSARVQPPVGRVPRSEMEIRKREGRYYAASVGRTEALSITYALGSGKTGTTYIAAITDGRMIELSKSFFPSSRTWYTTPGHEHDQPSDIGMVYSRDGAKRCLSCHAVDVKGDANVVPAGFEGVGCESCHGPGSRHIALMRAGTYGDIGIGRLGRLDSSAQMDVCGRCHRTSSMVDSGQEKMTNRFQPYALMKSTCYVSSGGALTCTTCHDPHGNVSRRAAAYERACLSCHSSSTGLKRRASGRICPVNTTSGCIPCHMPVRRVFVGSSVPTAMADHRIAIYHTTNGDRIPALQTGRK